MGVPRAIKPEGGQDDASYNIHRHLTSGLLIKLAAGLCCECARRECAHCMQPMAINGGKQRLQSAAAVGATPSRRQRRESSAGASESGSEEAGYCSSLLSSSACLARRESGILDRGGETIGIIIIIIIIIMIARQHNEAARIRAARVSGRCLK